MSFSDNQVGTHHHFSKNLNYLMFLMEKMSENVNDKEICRRLRIFIITIPLDISDEQLNQLKRLKKIILEKSIPEHILPFYKHYLFMLRRQADTEYRIA